MAEGKIAYRVMTHRARGQPNRVFYMPDSIKPDYPVVMLPGFAKSHRFYHHMGDLFARDGILVVFPDWDDGRQFSEDAMIETVYQTADMLTGKLPIGDRVLKEEYRFDKIAALGHSYGGRRLLKAALRDPEKRFAAVVAIQPPDRLGKYIGNHSTLYRISKMPVIRFAAIPWAVVRKPALHVRTPAQQRRLLNLIDSETSLLETIDAATGYETPTKVICSPSDGHVSYEDSLAVVQHLRDIGARAELTIQDKLYKYPTDEQMEEIFGLAQRFFERVINGRVIKPYLEHPLEEPTGFLVPEPSVA